MLKKLSILLFLFLLCGCSNVKEDVVTIIEEDDNHIASINYPITKSKKLNKYIKKYVFDIYDSFLACPSDNVRNELNIDFSYNKIDNFLIVVLFNNFNSTVKTFNYDLSKNKLINIDDILTNNDLSILDDLLDGYDYTVNNLEFSFDYKNLTVFLANQKFIIPLNKFDLQIDLHEVISKNEVFTYNEISREIDPNKKVVAFTFDDGPSKFTSRIVDLLKEYNSNATFFVLGNKVNIYEDSLKKLLINGNEIGNHSFNHKWLTHVSLDELLRQVNDTQDILFNTLGYTPTLFRPTYGSVNDTIRNNIGLKIVLWNIDTLDWKYKNSKRIASNSLSKIKDGDIILMHDTYEYTYNALKIMIPELIKNGFQLVTVSDLYEVIDIRKGLSNN